MRKNRRFVLLGKLLAIAVLTAHLLHQSLDVFGSYLMWGYSMERQETFGVSATPYVIAAIVTFVVFCLYALTLVLFIANKKAYLVLVSIASIGGFVSTLAFSLVFDGPMTSGGAGLASFTYYALPMAIVFLYYRAFSTTKVRNEQKTG